MRRNIQKVVIFIWLLSSSSLFAIEALRAAAVSDVGGTAYAMFVFFLNMCVALLQFEEILTTCLV